MEIDSCQIDLLSEYIKAILSSLKLQYHGAQHLDGYIRWPLSCSARPFSLEYNYDIKFDTNTYNDESFDLSCNSLSLIEVEIQSILYNKDCKRFLSIAYLADPDCHIKLTRFLRSLLAYIENFDCEE